MKKTLLTLVVMAFAMVSFAQKPAEGTLITEVNMNIANFSSNFELPNLRFRYFIAEDLVGRVDLGVQSGSSTQDVYENADGTGGTGTIENKASGFGIGLGIEKHFAGTNRLSPYVGLGLGFMSGSNSSTNTDAVSANNYQQDFSSTMERSNSMFSVAAILGADYWFAGNFYLGTEIGLGFSSNTVGETTMEVTSGGNTNKTVQAGSKSTSFGEFITPSFRLGFALN